MRLMKHANKTKGSSNNLLAGDFDPNQVKRKGEKEKKKRMYSCSFIDW